MKHFITIMLTLFLSAYPTMAQKVTIHADSRPASSVFRELMQQTDKNFIYSSAVLDGVNVTVHAENRPLKKVLSMMFRNSDINFRIDGNDVILTKRRKPDSANAPQTGTMALRSKSLEEVIIVSRLESPVVETAEIGAKKLTASDITNTPTLFGESDVIKTLHMQPGISEGTEGLAGMYVHGGNSDENLYMLDNVPLYQVNHFAGLFSAFNTEAIRYIDFFKSSIPAKYDGRLSSFLDVRTKNGSHNGHHGSARLGLTSGAFSINGPLGARTSYAVALRRSWYDVLTVPVIALLNSASDDEKIRFNYAFMDLNAKVSHRFNDRTSGYVSVYFGDDMLHTGDKNDGSYDYGYYYNDKYDFHWGNFVAQAGIIHRVSPTLTSEFTAAYTRYFSGLKKNESSTEKTNGETLSHTCSKVHTDNNISDWIIRADFGWKPAANSHIRFGVNYTRHSFLPSRTTREGIVNETKTVSRDSVWHYSANEVNAYIEDNWHISPHFTANAGLHASLFNIDGNTHYGVSPRLSVNYRIADNWALKCVFSHTTQYVHQLTQSYLSLPTDQWIPITGRFKPQTADKIALGAYWQSTDGKFSASVDGYWKQMHNLIEYRDEYYLHPPLEMWNERLTSGCGSAKGIDFKIEKQTGKITGHIAYSLAWSDRTFADKNYGKTYPARFDNRHTINILLNWKINKKIEFNAAWTGHSGNWFTLLPQTWKTPESIDIQPDGDVFLRGPVNNYRLPFYHRLDIGFTVRNSRGFWNFSLYNAYCHMNTIAIRRSSRDHVEISSGNISYMSKPVFQKISLLPIIPSISYTWQF